MIKNIIFDLGNVIINYNQKQIINNFTKKEEEINYIYNEIFNSPEWALMDLGDITNDEAIETINKRNGFKYVLSNMANLTYEYFKNDEFFALCTGIVISAHEHIKKPDERVYKLLLERYNLKAEECLFIDDDDSGRNYQIANRIGIKGRKVRPNQIEDIQKLLIEFKVEI